MIFLVIFAYIAFPNAFIKDDVVKAQIDTEIQALEKEYQPVLNYLAKLAFYILCSRPDLKSTSILSNKIAQRASSSAYTPS
jgi:hypothetical protein